MEWRTPSVLGVSILLMAGIFASFFGKMPMLAYIMTIITLDPEIIRFIQWRYRKARKETRLETTRTRIIQAQKIINDTKIKLENYKQQTKLNKLKRDAAIRASK